MQVVSESAEDSRAYVVDEDGRIESTNEFWARERAARELRFGRMTPELFELQSGISPTDTITVDVFVAADVPEPQLPFDGTDMAVPIEAFEQWTAAHSRAQQARIAAAKARVRGVLVDNGATILEDPRGLPIIRVTVSPALLQSQELNANDVVRIDPAPTRPAKLLGYAGRAAMHGHALAGGLDGGLCGSACDGGRIDVGLWERDPSETDYVSGLARNNTRISSGGGVTGYFKCPRVCSTDEDCNIGSPDGHRFCRAPLAGGTKICVQDHLSWVAASVGMYGGYSYDTYVPGGADPTPNASVYFASTGAWNVDYRIGNDDRSELPGLDYLIAPPPADDWCEMANAPPSVYVNRSVDGTLNYANWPGRAYGTFVVAAAGNDQSGPVTCAHLKNGLCVGMFDYRTYNDIATHSRTTAGMGSSYLNATFDSTLERPHLLGPGNHNGNASGLHMPSIDVSAGSNQMRHASYDFASPRYKPILGTSFAAPAVLSAAIQAHQSEGWFSALAFPMVNKAVLLASTRDANNVPAPDGEIGKATTWSGNAPNQDAEDGAGQIKFGPLKTILGRVPIVV